MKKHVRQAMAERRERRIRKHAGATRLKRFLDWLGPTNVRWLMPPAEQLDELVEGFREAEDRAFMEEMSKSLIRDHLRANGDVPGLFSGPLE